MSDHGEPVSRQPIDDHIGSLLRLAGPREEVTEERASRVKASVRAKWKQQAHARSRRIVAAWSLAAVAAALALFAVRQALLDDRGPQIPVREVARIEVLSGTSRPMSSPERDEGRALFHVGDRILEGGGVDTTAGGQVALRLAGGAAVRIDQGTRLRLVSDGVLALDEGAIYIDSGHSGGTRSLEVRTLLGVVRDIGTRFEIRLVGPAVRVRVREGAVRLSRDDQTHDAGAGDELTADDSGAVRRQSAPVHGPDWAWATALAPPFHLEGRSLRDYLSWTVGENGWQLRFEDAAAGKKSMTTILHGSIEGLTPEEALSAVLPASGVQYRLEAGVLSVRTGSGQTKD